RQRRHLPRLHPAVAEGDERIVGFVPDDLRDDTDADATDLRLLTARPPLPDGTRRHAHHLRPPVALQRELEGLAAALLDRLHELVGRVDRLAPDRDDEIAGAHVGPLGRRAGVDRADLRRELRSRAGLSGLLRVARTAAERSAGRTKFIPGPAKTMRKRAGSGLRANALVGS